MILKFLLISSLFLQSSAEIEIPESRNLSEMATGEDEDEEGKLLALNR
jgi:hypothetical protein